MKIKIKIIYSLISALFFMGCSESYYDDLELYPALTPRYLNISASNLFFTSAKSEQNVDVKSVQTPWKFENAIDWIYLSSFSGNSDASINIGVSENLDADLVRTGIIYLKSDVENWTFETPISITQERAEPSIVLSKDYFDFNGTSNSGSVDIIANCKVKVYTEDDWIIAKYADNKITFSITSNETLNYRNGQISITNSNASVKKIININQAPSSINASADSLVFDNNASEVEITINSESSWAARALNSWIEITPTSGNAGVSKMKISVSPNTSINERNGNIILTVAGNQRIRIPIRQRGIFIEVENPNIQYEATGGAKSISLLSNTTWEITSSPEWITFDKTSGKGNMIITATASDNPNTTGRSGDIHIVQEGLSIDCVVSVTQLGKTFEIDSNVLYFEDKQNTQAINIESNGTWYASSNNDWITVAPPTSSGNSLLSISVTENTDNNERQGSVSVSLGDKTSIINVIQKGKFFTVDNSILTYKSTGGDIKIAVSTNDAWTAKVEGSPSWLKLSAYKGNGTADVIATASDNASVNKRHATIILETVNHQSVRILVTQNARYLTVDANGVLFYYKGGESEPITISTDGQYKITNSDSWFTTSVNDNKIIVNTQENKTNDPRVGYITIELTDLIEGSLALKLRVTQLNNGGSFIINDFNTDEDYDKEIEKKLDLTINAYDNDTNLDSSSYSSITLKITDYKSDSNWDKYVSSGLTVNRTGYNDDKNLDSTSSSDGKISRKEYDEDKNWN